MNESDSGQDLSGFDREEPVVMAEPKEFVVDVTEMDLESLVVNKVSRES